MSRYNNLGTSTELWYCMICLNEIFPFQSLSHNEFANNISLNQYDNMTAKWSSSILTNKCGIFNENSIDHNLQSNCYNVNECKQKVCLSDTNFDIIHLNCRSLPRSFDNIELLFNDLGNPFDYIVLSETWLSDVNANLYAMDGFNLFCCQRISGIGGGLCFYVRNCFDVSILSLQFDCKTFEHFQVTINISKSHKLICSAIYIGLLILQ